MLHLLVALSVAGVVVQLAIGGPLAGAVGAPEDKSAWGMRPSGGVTVQQSRYTNFTLDGPGDGGCPAELYIGTNVDPRGIMRPPMRTIDLSEKRFPIRVRDLPAGRTFWQVSSECHDDYLTGGSGVADFRVPTVLDFDHLGLRALSDKRRTPVPAIETTIDGRVTRIRVRVIANMDVKSVVVLAVRRGSSTLMRVRTSLELRPGRTGIATFQYRHAASAAGAQDLTAVATVRTRSGAIKRQSSAYFRVGANR
ncbi:MAG: hypothetical protein JWM90_1349 [Thermoleophilia bacterium]|nr:hypothetical protein [Thermoleophilia bacterium]